DFGDDAVAVHRARSGFLRNIDVAPQARHGHVWNHEAVAVAVDIQPSHSEFAADARRGVMPGARFDDLASLDQAVQLFFQLLARSAGVGPFPEELLEVRAAVRELANVLD